MNIYSKLIEATKQKETNKYILGQDIRKSGEKRYINFNKFNDLYIYYKDNKFLYEILYNDNRKLYFDIDNIKYNNVNDIKKDIKKFIKALNSELKINIKFTDGLYFYRDDNDNIIKSIHIIFYKYSTDRKNILNICKNLKASNNDNDIIKNLDLKIYDKNRCFKLPYMAKMGKNKMIELFNNDININKIDKSKFKKALINETDKTIILKDNIINNEALKIEKEEENKELKYISSLDEIIYIMINNNEDNNNNDFNNDFYNSSEWSYILLSFIKFNIKEDIINNFLIYSSNITNNKYKIDDNKAYYNDIFNIWKDKKNLIKSSINYLLKIISKFYKYKLVNNIILNNSLLDFIISNSNEDKNIIINKFNKEKERQLKKNDKNIFNKSFIIETDILKYSFNENLLYIKASKKTILNEYQYKKIISTYINNNNNNMININNISDSAKYLKDFYNNKYSLLMVRSAWGTGKTSHIIKNILDFYKDDKYKKIIFTDNNALNNKHITELKEEYNDVSNHINNNKKDENANIYIWSFQSIQKLYNNRHIKNNKNNILIFDEFETLLKTFDNATTFKNINSPYENFKKLIYLIKNAYKIICLDADISNLRFNLIEKIYKKKYIFLNNLNNINNDRYINYSNDYNIRIYYSFKSKEKRQDENKFLNDMKIDINNNKKIIIGGTGCKNLKAIYKNLDNIYKKTKNILIITGNYTTLNNDEKYKDDIRKININDELRDDEKTNEKNKIKKKYKEDILIDIEDFIKKNKIDIFLYTQTIKTGISIDIEYFNKLYFHNSTNATIGRENIQMLFRARRLKDKEINIYNKNYFNQIKENIDINIIKNNLINRRKMIYEKNKDYINNDYEIDILKEDKDILYLYYDLRSINILEEKESTLNYMKQFIMMIKYIHNFKNIDLINCNEYSYIDHKKENSNIKNEMIIKDIEEFINIKIIDDKEYKKLDNYKEINKELTSADSLKYFKYILFNKTFKIYNIYDVKKYDEILKRNKILKNMIKDNNDISNLILVKLDNGLNKFIKPNNKPLEDEYNNNKDELYKIKYNILNKCNNKLFYKKYNNDNFKEKYKTLEYIFNDNNNIYEIDPTNKIEIRILKSRLIKELLYILKIDFIKKEEYIYSNIELEKIIMSNEEKIKEILYKYFNNVEKTYKKQYEKIKNDYSYKNIKKIIFKLLKYILINISYSDPKSTNRPAVKITFNFKDVYILNYNKINYEEYIKLKDNNIYYKPYIDVNNNNNNMIDFNND